MELTVSSAQQQPASSVPSPLGKYWPAMVLAALVHPVQLPTVFPAIRLAINKDVKYASLVSVLM
jgi:hypothetical protein